ncbi:MAG: SPW repeat protein [Candidatus Paceibacterota bacterium]
MSWNYWLVFGLGIWVLVSPWILGFSSYNIALWSNILSGCLISLFVMWNFTPPEE